MATRTFGRAALLVVLLAGCTAPTSAPKDLKAGAAEAEVRELFGKLQAAVKGRDADALWGLLDGDSRQDADRQARAIQEAYVKAADPGRIEKQTALTAADLRMMTGKAFLRSNRFIGKYDEIPDSKLDKVNVKGESAELVYLEPDNDREKLRLVREDGQWKVNLPMPEAVDR